MCIRICYLLTLWLALPALSRYFGLHDATVATIACVTGAAGLTLPASLQFISEDLILIIIPNIK